MPKHVLELRKLIRELEAELGDEEFNGVRVRRKPAPSTTAEAWTLISESTRTTVITATSMVMFPQSVSFFLVWLSLQRVGVVLLGRRIRVGPDFVQIRDQFLKEVRAEIEKLVAGLKDAFLMLSKKHARKIEKIIKSQRRSRFDFTHADLTTSQVVKEVQYPAKTCNVEGFGPFEHFFCFGVINCKLQAPR